MVTVIATVTEKPPLRILGLGLGVQVVGHSLYCVTSELADDADEQHTSNWCILNARRQAYGLPSGLKVSSWRETPSKSTSSLPFLGSACET